MRARARALTVAAVLAACAGTAPAGWARDGSRAGSAPRSASSNWSGYSVTSGGGHSAVGAHWTQPAASCGPSDSWASFWVGLDGDGSSTVEQIGTAAECHQGRPYAYAWYELYPKDAVVLKKVQVRPGDRIEAAVNAGPTGSYTLQLHDVTTGRSQVVTKNLRQARNVSAEVIAEAPAGADGRTLPLTSFGTVSFDEVWIDGRRLGDLSPNPISMVDGDTVKAVPSALSSSTSFSISWLHS